MCDSDPPLLLTHGLSKRCPQAQSISTDTYTAATRDWRGEAVEAPNVNVELLSYRPVRLSELAATARALLAGEIEPQRTTARTVALARRRGRISIYERAPRRPGADRSAG